MALEVEGIVDGGMNAQKALRPMPLIVEEAFASCAPAGGTTLMRILRPIVFAAGPAHGGRKVRDGRKAAP